MPREYHLLQQRTEGPKTEQRWRPNAWTRRGTYIKHLLNGRNYLPAPIWTESTPWRTTEADGQKADTTSIQRREVDRTH